MGLEEEIGQAKADVALWLIRSNRKTRRAAGFTERLPKGLRMAKFENLHAPTYGHPRVHDKYGNLLESEEYYEKYPTRLRSGL